jgi:hypothetical protein
MVVSVFVFQPKSFTPTVPSNMKRGKLIPLVQRINDDAYSIVAQYQTEYRGIVQYYRLAYNLHRLSHLKWIMETSLTKTLARKFKTSRRKIYKRYQTEHQTQEGTYKVIQIKVDRRSDKTPLITHFGGVPLKWNKWVAIGDTKTIPIWSGRSEVVERLLAQQCELCGSDHTIEVHHIRKLADLQRKGQKDKRQWVRKMVARRRKTLVVCQKMPQ